MAEAKKDKQASKRKGRANKIYWVIVVTYIAVLLVIVVPSILNCIKPVLPLFRKFPVPPPWLIAGLLIGAIYVAIALCYFHENFLSPYLKEEPEGEEGDRPNIYVWMVQWFTPALVLQIFVILGFMLTIGGAPFRESVYTHAYKYGLDYKHIETLVAREKPIEKELEDIRGYLKKKKKKTTEKPDSNQDTRTTEDLELIIYKIPFLIALAFGFLGTLVYSLKDTAHRFFTSDLYAKTFVTYMIRFIFAPSLCIIIAYFLMNDWWVNTTPLIFFFIGFFPQRALQYFEEKASKALSIKREEKKQEIPLGLIQGMTDYIIYRFREIGIDDVQNLAYIKLDYLRRNIGYSDRLLYDFVAQALLLVHLRDDFPTLQAYGIRHIISFGKIVNENNYAGIAQSMKIPAEKLSGLIKLIKDDIIATRLSGLEKLMVQADTQEKVRLQKGLVA